MKARFLAPILLLLVSCGLDRDAGHRYQAERDMWRANWEYKRLSIRPQDVTEAEWKALADRFERVGSRSQEMARSASPGATRQAIETVAANALFAAAQLHATVRDSIAASAIYEKMARDFADVPELSGEVAYVRGQIAEGKGDSLAAASLYQDVVERVKPDPGATGVGSIVISLPLKIARLHAGDSPRKSAAERYAPAREYYERLVREHPGDVIQIDAQSLLAQIAADMKDWDEAISALRALEAQLRGMAKPPRDPASIRYAIAGVQNLSGTDLGTVRATLNSIIEDYPKSNIVWQALLALATNANRRDQVDEALGYLDRITKDYRENEEACSEAMLYRARLLEGHDRWPEALEAYHSLYSTHPVSEQALGAPLEIAAHYSRANDQDGMKSALSQAERDYRDFVVKYPPGKPVILARERLIQTLALQRNYASAVDEMLKLGEDEAGTKGGASYMIRAAQMACSQLADTSRAITILNHVGEMYGRAKVGAWAIEEANRLKASAKR